MSNIFVFRQPPKGFIDTYFGGGGKGGTTTSSQTVSIPPEVLARYNSVNARAEDVAQQPFQQYGGEFVAGLTPTQVAGTNATNAAAGQAQPYYGAATQNLMGAQQGGANYIDQATGQLNAAQQAGQGLGAAAGQQYGQAGGVAGPYYQAATQGTQQALAGAQPYQQAATMAALAGAQGIDPGRLQTGRYMNPYVGSVVGATQAAMGQQQGQQLAQQQAEAIRAGAFGGERAGLQRQTLRGQQELAQAQAIAPLYQQGYQQALQTAQQQQGVGLGAAQANRAAIQQAGQQLAGLGQQGYSQQLGAAQQMQGLGQGLYGQALGVGQAVQGLGQQQYAQGAQTAQQLAALGQQGYTMGAGTAQQLAGLGTGAQSAALQGAQAQLAAGQIGQQTQQAQDTAQYQQFLQERGYPFQVAQFLANIAMGTGALSGSTTSGTQTSPGGFFSDKRLKNDVKEIGETHDGQPIYSYKYNGDDRTQIGLMAQDVEKKHPDAVGLMGGYKTVDYKKATEDAERTHKDMGGGLVPDGFDPSSMGGAVTSDMAGESFERGGYVGGGLVDSNDWANIVAANKQALGVYGGAQPMGGPVGATGIVPAASIPVPKPIEAAKMSMPAQRPAGLSTAMQTGKDIAGTYKGGKEFLLGSAADKSAGLIGGGGSTSGKSWGGELKDWWNTPSPAATGGLIVPRHAYAGGGSDDEETTPYDVSMTMSGQDPMKDVLKSGSHHAQLMTAKSDLGHPGGQGGQSGQSGLGQLASGLGTAKSLYGMGTGAASGLADLGAGFSSVGNAAGLDSALGSGFYGANIGLGAGGASAAGTGIMGSIGEGLGSIASYLPFALAAGGTADRQAFQQAGLAVPDVPADYSPEADLPSPGAQEAGLVVEQPAHDSNASFQRAFGNLMRREGGLGVDNNRALVNFGMNQAAHPEVNVRDLTKEDAAQKYRNEYWNAVGGDKLHPDLANVALDTAAMAGPTKARNLLQSSGGDPVDMLHQRQQFLQNLVASGKLNDDGTPRYGPNVAKAWQNRYESMLGDLGAKPQVNLLDSTPKGVVGVGIDRATPSGAEGKKSIGDVVTSEGFLVPALGFLGSMLASDKRNLGQALGEGIMGGVGAYQQQRKMLPEVAKTEAEASLQNVAAINSLSSGLKQYNAMNGTNLTLQQFSKLSPAEIAKYAGTEAAGAVSGQKTSAKGYSFTPEEMQTLVIKHPGGADIPAYMDPGYLNEYKSHYAGWGDNAYAKSQLAFADKQIEKTGTTTLSSAGEVVPTPGAIQTGQQALSGQQRVAMSSDFEKKGAEFRPMSVNIETHLEQLSDALQRFKTGSDAPSRANLDKLMEAVDPDHKFKSLHNNEGADYDKIIKSAMAIQIAQLQGLSARAPAAELNALSQQIVRPDIQPDAARQIVANLKATNAYQRKMYDEYDPEKFGYNISSYQKDFMDKNPYPEFREKIVKNIAPGAGTQQQREQSLIIPTIKNDEDYNSIKSGSTYIAPDGTTRRKP